MVETSIDYRVSMHSNSPDEKYLQRNEKGPQTFVLLDMESGKIVKTYSFDAPGCYLRGIWFSSDDKTFTIWYNTSGGGGIFPPTYGIIVDIEASLKAEE